ncbi:MAG: aminoglycoside phosphotransferase family protein [Pyrinomonadaceae bacterium]
MSQNTSFDISAHERLKTFLLEREEPQKPGIELLTPDASTREYFRIRHNNSPAIACVYAEPFVEKKQNYLDVTNLFLAAGLPVAKIYDFDGELGVIILEDFGNLILRDVLIQSDDEQREKLINEAITLIARIQAATPKAYEHDSIASRLKFDEEKLLWELNFFKTHSFESFRKTKLSAADKEGLNKEFTEISRELESAARVLCHRDFHAANLMIDGDQKLRIIDHQDARIGSTSYDLVSLLLDRISEPPSTVWIREKRLFFLAEREKLGLETLDPDEFAAEFRLQTIQRCLKAIGTFSYQSTFREKLYFIQFIKPMFQVVLRACERLEKFPVLQKIIEGEMKR